MNQHVDPHVHAAALRAHPPLYVTDAEAAVIVGVGVEKLREIAAGRTGFPARDPLFAHKRYYPAIRAWLDRRNNVAAESGVGQIDGEEPWQTLK